MPLFREPPPPTPQQNETLGEKAARLSRQPAPPPPGRGYVLLAIAAITIGGLVYTSFSGGGAVTKNIRDTHEKGLQDAAKEEAAKARADTTAETPPPSSVASQTSPPAESTPPATPPPQVPVAPARAPAPSLTEGPGMEIDLADIVPKIRRARAEDRPLLRKTGLEFFVEVVRDPRARRPALIEVAKLASDAAPEEADLFARITRTAVTDGLVSPTDAAAALLYLGALRDRGGPEAVVLVENLVLDERRPMELRVAAARILPADVRPRTVKTLVARPDPHPVLLSALK